MESTLIDSLRHPLYEEFASLYASSFPVFEQRTAPQQAAAFAAPEYRLAAFSDKAEFAGFIASWEFSAYVYIEHFAVASHLRGRGYGSRILADFVGRAGKTVILEIDPVNDPISAARLKFYLSAGFRSNDFAHLHPPYREGFEAHPLTVMSSPDHLADELYRRFADDLAKTVMHGGQ